MNGVAKRVKELAEEGLSQFQIVAVLRSECPGIEEDIHTEELRQAYASGRAETTRQIAAKVLERAKGGDMNAAGLWLRTQAGWRETTRTELVRPDIDFASLTTEQLERIKAGEDVERVLRIA